MGYKGECISTRIQRYWVISTQMYRFPGHPHSFRAFLNALAHPTKRLAPHVAIRGHTIRAGRTRVELEPLAKKLERLAARVLAPTTFRPPTRSLAVRVRLFGWC